MSTDERVAHLEDKLSRAIELLELIVRIDNGLTKDNTDWLLEQLEELQNQEV